MTSAIPVMEPLRHFQRAPPKADRRPFYCGTEWNGSDWNGHESTYNARIVLRPNQRVGIAGPTILRPANWLFVTKGGVRALDVLHTKRR